MSHFIGLCFGECWESYLDQYDENLVVDPYIAHTKEDAIDIAIQNHVRHYKDAVNRLKEDSLSKGEYEYFNKIVDKGPSISRKQAWEDVKEWGYQMDDKENLLTTYNPDSKWDWYEIGGRWSGFLKLKKDGALTNEAYFYEIDWEWMKEFRFAPFCFVDEDGVWHDKGEMGWWGMVTDEQPDSEWQKTFEDYLNEVDPDCLVTVVDFHI